MTSAAWVKGRSRVHGDPRLRHPEDEAAPKGRSSLQPLFKGAFRRKGSRDVKEGLKEEKMEPSCWETHKQFVIFSPE